LVDMNLEKEDTTFPQCLKIEELKLLPRTYKTLKDNGIDTIKDIISLTENEILGLKKFGKKSYDDIIKKLQPYEVTLAEESSCNYYEVEVNGYTFTYKPENIIKISQESLGFKYVTTEQMNLSLRAYLVLKRNKIDSLVELCNYTSKEIKDFYSIGEKTYLEINDKVHELGGKLAGEIIEIDDAKIDEKNTDKNDVLKNGMSKQQRLDDRLSFSINELINAYRELQEKLIEAQNLREELQKKLNKVGKEERGILEERWSGLQQEIEDLEEIKIEIIKRAKDGYDFEF